MKISRNGLKYINCEKNRAEIIFNAARSEISNVSKLVNVIFLGF